MPWLVQTVQFLWGSAFGIVLDRLMTCPLACRFFWAVYTGTRPGFPRHLGGEGVAGTPGACSQVFCHPIRCIVGMTLDRHGVL